MRTMFGWSSCSVERGMIRSQYLNYLIAIVWIVNGLFCKVLNFVPHFRRLADKYGWDAIYYWRTADGNEVDFVLPEIENPFAIETKYDEALIKPNKYKKVTKAYPGIPLHFAWL